MKLPSWLCAAAKRIAKALKHKPKADVPRDSLGNVLRPRRVRTGRWLAPRSRPRIPTFDETIR